MCGVVNAWTGPTSAPPAGNTDEPLNVSNRLQTKAGYFYVPRIYDANNDGYYVDPASNSWLYRLYSYDVRSSIFYDLDNTGYYVDPASTSVVNAQTSNSLSTGYLDFRYAGGNSGRGNDAYAIFQEGGSWSYPYPDLRIAYHTGIKLGAHASYNGIRFYNDYNMSTLVMSVNDASTGGANNVYIPYTLTAGTINLGGVSRTTWPSAAAEADTLDTVANRGNTTSNWIQSNSSVRAPLFYDSNNTGYYVDPNGTSRMNTLYYVNQAYIVDVRPQYMYDWNDSAYYIDMNNTSRLNYGIYNNLYSYGWLQSSIFYDANNNGYYVDPNSTSVLNTVYGTAFLYHSDESLKKNVNTIKNATDKINRLRGVDFEWKETLEKDMGFVAQEVEKVLPELVKTDSDTGLKSVKYGNITALLVEALKEQNRENEKQNQKIIELEEKINSLINK